jgi:exonuclease SbcD
MHLTGDQAHILDEFVSLVRDAKVDAVVVAGDIYDRAVPPPDAVLLLDDVISRIAVGFEIPVLMIAGNHDSPERVAFGSRVLSQRRVHVVGSVTPQVNSVVLNDEHGPVNFYLIPYAEPAVVREKFEDDSAVDHCAGMKLMVDRVNAAHPGQARSVVIAHAFVAGGEESESERPLSVGGSGSVDARIFSGFNYVALGHLHRPQTAGAENVTYSGSLMKYSFSEADHKKRIQIVDLDKLGKVKIEEISLNPRRDVRRMQGTIGALLNGMSSTGNREDYLEITLLDKGAVLDPIGKLREVYPNLLHLRRPEFLADGNSASTRADHRKVSDFDLFRSFFTEVTGDEILDEQASAYRAVIEKMSVKDREA